MHPDPPRATSEAVRRSMQANRVDTRPERLLRSELHRRGLRFRKNLRLDLDDRRVRPDIVFSGSAVAIFVDGCFWHRCPEHSSWPRANAAFWKEKFRRNVTRDRLDDAALTEAGWTVIRVWEHEDLADAANRICDRLPSDRPSR
jgi:DNA mismatch endonuclease, patch repair protein